MALSARSEKVLAARRANPFQQFGQSADAYTANGATSCAHTVLQFLALLWTGQWYTQDELSRVVGYPNQSRYAPAQRRGMRPSEVQAFIKRARLPYRVAFSLSSSDVIRASVMGPVGFGHAYSHWPEWKGARYGGVTADGSPNGFALPNGRAGRTQLTGFNGAHFGLLIGRDAATDRVYAWEPNHGSPARPERPPYDQMSTGQFRVVYDSYMRRFGRKPYAIVATKYLPL